jgi:hypothetical protein
MPYEKLRPGTEDVAEFPPDCQVQEKPKGLMI